MDLGKNAHIRLEPEDEYMHPIEAASNFNESMYINLFDHDQACGGWFRVGNRPNEGHAEMSFCFYLPDGRVAFMCLGLDGEARLQTSSIATRWLYR